MPSATISIGPYDLPVGRHYDPETHLWVAPVPEGTAQRVGFDPLGAETSGDIVAVSIEPEGTRVARGQAFGSLEAAKFVGPLIAPISGVIRAHNGCVAANPSLVNQSPLDSWLAEIEPDDFEADVEFLLSDPVEIASWLKREVASFKDKGMVAE